MSSIPTFGVDSKTRPLCLSLDKLPGLLRLNNETNRQTILYFGFFSLKSFLTRTRLTGAGGGGLGGFSGSGGGNFKIWKKMINSFLEVKWKAARWDHGKCYLSDNKIISENNIEPLSSDSVAIWLFQSKIVKPKKNPIKQCFILGNDKQRWK